MEKDRHKWLKERATKWLRSRGCTDIRYEVCIHIKGRSELRIDVVGFRAGKPVIGIECGELNSDACWRKEFPFPVFWLPFHELLDLDADDGDEHNLAGCKPYRHENYSAIAKELARKHPKTRGKYPWTRGEGAAPWA